MIRMFIINFMLLIENTMKSRQNNRMLRLKEKRNIDFLRRSCNMANRRRKTAPLVVGDVINLGKPVHARDKRPYLLLRVFSSSQLQFEIVVHSSINDLDYDTKCE